MMKPRNFHSKPKSILIEKTAMSFATTFYEVGRSQGLKSKFKTHKAYAKANWYKFIPRVVDAFLQMLNDPKYNDHVKLEIYEALMERHNDPTLNKYMPALPDIDVKKVLAVTGQQKIVVRDEIKTVLNKDFNAKKDMVN